MKRLPFFLFFLVYSILLIGQTSNGDFNTLNVRNNFGGPIQDTITSAYKIGELRTRPQDNLLYRYNGKAAGQQQWDFVYFGPARSFIPNIDQVLTIGNASSQGINIGPSIFGGIKVPTLGVTGQTLMVTVGPDGTFSSQAVPGTTASLTSINALTAPAQFLTTTFTSSTTSPKWIDNVATHALNLPLGNTVDTGLVTPAQIISWNGKFTFPSGGNTGQYVDGTGLLQTFPSIPDTGKFTVAGTGLSITGNPKWPNILFTITAGGTGNPNANVGSGFRWAIPNTNNIKTFFANSTAGLALDSSTTNALTISQLVGSASQNGYIASSDWVTFNTKEAAITGPNTTNKYWNGYKQFVTLNTDSITEGTTNKFFTVGRAQAAITLTTTTTTGAATYISGVFNIPQYQGAITFSTTGTTGLSTFSSNTLNIPAYQGQLSNRGSAFRLFDPTTNGIKTILCTGCTLDSSTAGQIGITVSGGGSLPALSSNRIFIGNASNATVDTPFITDLGMMQEIDQWSPGLGQNATIDSIAGYNYRQVDSTPFYYTTTGVGGEKGGWLTNSTSGDSIQIGPPFCVIIGNSIAAGHKSLVGRLETPGGVGGFLSNYPDSAGQLSYEFRSLTNMRWYNAGIGGQTTTQIRNRFLRDAIGLQFSVSPDGRPGTTLPRKPSFILIEGGINDFFNGVPLATTEANILWMVEMCKEYDIPCAVFNCPGDAISNQVQLSQIKQLNEWLKSGVLSSYNCFVIDMNTFWNDPAYGNDNFHHIADISDDIHFTPTGYHNFAIYTFNQAHLPVLDSVRFLTGIAPSGGIANYNRPTSVTTGSGSAYSATYSLTNSSSVTVAVTQPILDSTWWKINSSTNVVGSSTVTGFSSVLFHLGNNPTHKILYTRKTHFNGGFTGLLQASRLTMNGMSGSGDTTVDIRLFDGVNRGFQIVTANSGSVFFVNGLLTATRFSNAIFNVNAPGATGIGTNGNIFSTGATSQIANLQLTFNTHAGTTGYGISNSNSGQCGMRFEVNGTASVDDFLWTYWNEPGTTTKAVTAASSGAITHYHFPLGWTSFNTTNQTANSILIDPILNNTASFSGSTFVGIHYKPTVTALTGTNHIGLWIESGATYLSTATSDPVLIGVTTNNNGRLQIGAASTGLAQLFLNGSSVDPSSPLDGMFWYNSSTHTLNFRDNSTTINLLAGGGSAFYQTVQLNSSSQTQRGKLNFSSDFTAADNSGNGSTDIGVKNFFNANGTISGGDRTVTVSSSNNVFFTGSSGVFVFNNLPPTIRGRNQNFLAIQSNSGSNGFVIERSVNNDDANDFAIVDVASGGGTRFSISPFGKVIIPDTVQIVDGNQAALKVLQSDASGNGNWGPIVTSGSYSPTVTAITNCTTTGTPVGYYQRVGNIVYVDVPVAVNPTVSATQVVFTVSLPIASNFTIPADLTGQGSLAAATTVGVIMFADATSDVGQGSFVTTSSGSALNTLLHFSYIVK